MTRKPSITTRRVYDSPDDGEGERFLVDRLWPRGLKKEKLALDGWVKPVAPSDKLRKWFGHDVHRWADFQTRYFAELDKNPESWKPLADAIASGRRVTLLYGARDQEHNNAVALKAYLLKHL